MRHRHGHEGAPRIPRVITYANADTIRATAPSRSAAARRGWRHRQMRHQSAIDEIETEGPTEGDWQTEDHLNFYQDGKHVLRLQMRTPPREIGVRWRSRDAEAGEVSDAAMWRQIDEVMARQKFYPNVWFISDHGNAHLMVRSSRRHR